MAASQQPPNGEQKEATPISKVKIETLPPVHAWLVNRPEDTPDKGLWSAIKHNANRLSFQEYDKIMRELFGMEPLNGSANTSLDGHQNQEDNKLLTEVEHQKDELLKSITNYTAIHKMNAYQTLNVITDIFLQARCGVVGPDPTEHPDMYDDWKRYTHDPLYDATGLIPYLQLVRKQLDNTQPESGFYAKLIAEKLKRPCMIELIWSYWMEEAMLVQAISAIVMRFQNRTSPGSNKLHFTSMPHGLLNHLIWGFIQDTNNQLTLARRNDEYAQQYGFMLEGRAVPRANPVESRSKFLEAFHNLLYRCKQFYRQADDKTVEPDAFPVLNALADVHLQLTEGMNNQFGDLPYTARKEMLMMQFILGQPEMRQFLGGKPMVDFPETWMEHLETMKELQGWSDISVLHFWKLANFGEQILLSIRYANWTSVTDSKQAANWALDWRSEIQGYIHAYQAVTTVDVAADTTDAQATALKYLPPSVHLRNRLALQQTARTPQARLVG